MALGSQVVYLIRLDLLDDPDQVGGIGQIAVVQDEVSVFGVRVLVEVIYSVCVKT